MSTSPAKELTKGKKEMNPTLAQNEQIKYTKESYKKFLLENLKNNSNPTFDISKIDVSKNDPVMSTVNKVLSTI